jgi:hypothetical protein
VAHVPERPLRGDEAHYQEQASKLLAGQPLPAFFLFPPLYPRMIACVYWALGPHRLALELTQSVLLLGTGLLLRRLLLRGGVSTAAADTAVALFLVDPQTAAFAQYLWPEVPHLFLALAGLVLLVGGSGTWKRVLAAGILFGLAILARSLLSAFVPVFVFAAAARAREPGIRARNAALLALGVLLMVLPVVISNGVSYGYWGVASSAPFNLWVGINDPASRTDYDTVPLREGQTYLASSSDENERTRILWRRVQERVSQDGVLPLLAGQLRKQYVRLFDKNSFFTDQLPGGRWDPDSPTTTQAQVLRAWAYLSYAVLLVAASLGMAILPWRQRLREAAIPALFLAYNLCLFLLLHVKTRYRIAFIPSLVFFAAFAFDWLLGVAAHRRSEPSFPVPAARLLAGTVLAGLALSLAFWPG